MADLKGVDMPVNKKKMAAMKKEYGAKKAKEVYYAVENKQKQKKKKPAKGKSKKLPSKAGY